MPLIIDLANLFTYLTQKLYIFQIYLTKKEFIMLLEDFHFMKNITHEDKTFLANMLKPITVPKDTLLFYQGDVCEDILLLTEGEIKVYLHSPSIETVTLYYLHPGEQCIVNTSSAISSTPAIATAKTTSNITGWLLPKQSVKTLMIRSESYQEFIFSLFTIKLSSLTQIIEDIKFSTLEERLMKKFKTLNTQMIQTTHEQLAIELGSTRVSISRVLKRLEQQNKIKLHRGKIEILRVLCNT